MPWDGDGNFTWERFDERYTSDLANDLGNLANRTLSMVHRYRGGIVPAGATTPLDRAAREVIAQYSERMDRYLLHEGAAIALRLVSEANSFIETRAPWKLARDPSLATQLDETLASLVRTLAVTSVLLFPFMPGKMTQLWESLGSESEMGDLKGLGAVNVTNWSVAARAVLFPRPETGT